MMKKGFKKINKIYEQMQEEILRDVARRLLSTTEKLGKPGMTESARWQINLMQETGKLYDDIVFKVAKYSNLSKKEVLNIFQYSEIQKYKNKKTNTKKLDKFKSQKINDLISNGVFNTVKEINNLTMTTALDTSNTFKNEINKSFIKVLNGTEDYETAINKSVKALAKNTGKVVYPSGYRSNIEVATRRAVLTSYNQVVGTLSLENARKLGTNLMELSAHSGARPSHAEWQGKIVALDGNTKGGKYLTLEDIGYGRPDGFKGCNCRHDWYPYFEGDPRSYTDEELQEINNATVYYGGRKVPLYETIKQQRYLEYQVRVAKRELIMHDELINSGRTPTLERTNAYIKAKANVDQKQRNLKRYLESTGLKQRGNTNIGKTPTKGRITELKRNLEQFKEYRDVLSDKPYMPNKLEEFINLKYNEVEWYRLQDNFYIEKKMKKGDWKEVINVNSQRRHMKSTAGTNKSYFYDDVDVEELYNKYHGKGKVYRKKSVRTNKEIIDITEENLGVDVYSKNEANTIIIHHSKTGYHIVPTFYGGKKK